MGKQQMTMQQSEMIAERKVCVLFIDYTSVSLLLMCIRHETKDKRQESQLIPEFFLPDCNVFKIAFKPI